MGHARALLGLADEAALRRAAADVMLKKLSVRQTEELVRAARGKSKGSKNKPGEEQGSAALRATQEQLQRSLGTRVRLVDNGRSGRMESTSFRQTSATGSSSGSCRAASQPGGSTEMAVLRREESMATPGT